jgi:serine/threonine-protein kinase
MTERGAVIGTHGYMSPEQARGQIVDARSDIFALGVMLYEMLTGRRPFGGDTPSDVLSSVIKDVPHALSSIRAGLPQELSRIVRRCLAKDPARRLQSALDLRNEMEDLRRELDSGELRNDVRAVSSVFAGRSRALGATLVVVAVLVAAVIVLIATRVPSERPRLPVAISVLIDGPNFGPPGVHLAVAPNGRTVVFRSNHGGRDVIYRRDLDRIDPEPIVGTVTGSDVFFSPDGRRLGFERASDSELWTAPLDGGTAQRLLPNQPLRGGTWGEDNQIVFGRVGSGLWITSASGGDPRQLTRPREGERHELPQILPGGRAVLFTILATNRPARAAVQILETGAIRELFEGVGAKYVGSGYVVFGRQGTLWAAAFDANALQMRGEARSVRDDVLWSAPGYPQFAVGADVLAYVRTSEASARPGNTVPVLADRQGNVQPLPFPAANYSFPHLSPTGDRFAALVGATRELWTYDLRRGTSTNLTSDRIVASSAPAWTPDAARIIFTTWFDGEVGRAWLPADGSGPVQALVKGVGMRSFESTHPVVLPDGSGVILTGLGPGASSEDLLFVRLNGEKRLETLFQARGVERFPAIAPNGRFIAYNSDESGRRGVYVRPFPDVGARRWTVSTADGHPVWTRGGNELVYRDRGRTRAVTMQSNGNGQVEFSAPAPVFSREPVDSGRGWDVTPDGERFLFLINQGGPAGSGAPAELIVIQNWTDELTRLLPRR